MPLNSFASNQGTQSALLTDNTGGTAGTLVPVMKLDISSIGTAGTLWNGGIPSGTINLGTFILNGGTLNLGTSRIDERPTQNILSFGTQISGTAAIVVTIVGSASVGVGTSLWLQDVSITNNNANVLCVLGFGTAQQGTNVLLRHTLGTAGAVGIEKSFGKLTNAGMTNQDLVFSLGAAGTIDLTLSYLISA